MNKRIPIKTKHTSITAVLLIAVLVMCLAGCGNTSDTPETGNEQLPTSDINPVSSEAGLDSSKLPESSQQNSASESSGFKTLVIYFSRTGEQYTVGMIDKGNTAIAAEMIAEKTGADLFEIIPADDHYPMTYRELTDVAKKEQNENARPEYRGSLPDLSQYDTIFIGAPVWWGDWPMIMYTVFESNDFSGKKLVPFSTHEGSGLSGFDRKLASSCPDSEILTGQAFRGNDCQNDKQGVESKINGWLKDLGY